MPLAPMVEGVPYVQEHIERSSRSCSWEEFCEKLYEIIWQDSQGWDDTYKLVHYLYKIQNICGISMAYKMGFKSFEEMLHSDKLSHVLTIEREYPYSDTEYTLYRYRPRLDNKHFEHIRRKVRPWKTDINEMLLMDYFRSGDDLLAGRETIASAPRSQQQPGPGTSSSPRKVMVEGELISYEIDDPGDDNEETDLQNAVEDDESLANKGGNF